MASPIDKNIAAIEKAIQDARNAGRSLKSFTFEGTNYQPEEVFDVLLPLLNTRLANANKQRSAAAKKGAVEERLSEREQAATDAVESRIIKRISNLENSLPDMFENVANGRMTYQEYKSKVDELGQLQSDLAQLNAGASAIPQGFDDYQITSETTEAQTLAATQSRERAQKQSQTRGDLARQEMTTPQPIKVEPKIINGKAVIVQTLPNGDVVVKDDDTTPSPSGGEPGGTGLPDAGVVVAGKGKKAKAAGITSTAWESKFRESFPSKSWLLDLDRSKYPQLFSLLQKSIDQKYYESQEGLTRFAAELEGTDYYRELALSGKAREIKSIVGDLGFDSTDFSKFLTDAVNQGWEGDRLKQKTYEEVFRRNPDGAFANPTALARARKSNDYLNVQLIATNYFNKPSDSSIEAVLTGRVMTEDFQRQQREIAKAKYAHLAPLIDQGVTLDDLATNFKQSAARLLELDPAAIDMSAAEYEVALNFGEEGKRRVMTTGEWERLLRTDQRYGWEKTENAKNEARSLATNIAQAFGRII